MPGIANMVVETLITSDQIGVEDRASVLRALLLKHRSATQHKNHYPVQQENQWINSVLENKTSCMFGSWLKWHEHEGPLHSVVLLAENQLGGWFLVGQTLSLSS